MKFWQSILSSVNFKFVVCQKLCTPSIFWKNSKTTPYSFFILDFTRRAVIRSLYWKWFLVAASHRSFYPSVYCMFYAFCRANTLSNTFQIFYRNIADKPPELKNKKPAINIIICHLDEYFISCQRCYQLSFFLFFISTLCLIFSLLKDLVLIFGMWRSHGPSFRLFKS